MSDKQHEADGGSTTFGERDVSGGSLLSVPLDIVLLLVAVAVSLPVVLGTLPLPGPVRILVGLPFVMFFPGYALTTALFPKRGRTGSGEDITALGGETIPRRIRSLSQRGLTAAERAALGLGVSMLTTPLLVIFLDLASLGYAPSRIVAVYTAVIVLASVVAVVRHRGLAPQDATGYTVSNAAGAYRRSLGRSSVDAVLVVAVTVCLLFAGVSGAFALASPQDAASYTDFDLVTQADDDYVMFGYPSTFTVGEPQTIHVRIENSELASTSYTVVVQLDRVRTDGEQLTVLSRERVGSFSTDVDVGETTYAPTQITLDSIGEDLRLTYLLYRGEAPSNPTTENAYRHTYIWVDVTAGGDDDGS